LLQTTETIKTDFRGGLSCTLLIFAVPADIGNICRDLRLIEVCQSIKLQ